MPLAIILAVLITGGVAAGAQTTEPGDFLYPIKTNVNERLETAFSFSTESKAEARASQANERIEESLELAAEGALDASLANELTARFNNQLEAALDALAEVKAKGRAEAAASIASDMEVALNAGEQALARIAANVDGDRATAIMELRNAIRTGVGAVATARTETEASLVTSQAATSTAIRADIKVAAENRKAAAETKISQVEAYLENRAGDLSAEAESAAETKLSAAAEALASGAAHFEAEAFAEAFASFQAAHRLAQEAQLILTSHINFGISIFGQGGESAEGSADASVESNTETNTGGNQGGASVEIEAAVDANLR